MPPYRSSSPSPAPEPPKVETISLYGGIAGAVCMIVASTLLFLTVHWLMARTIGVCTSPAWQRELEFIGMRSLAIVGGMWASGRLIGRMAERGSQQALVSACLFLLVLALSPPWWEGATEATGVILVAAMALGTWLARRGAVTQARLDAIHGI